MVNDEKVIKDTKKKALLILLVWGIGIGSVLGFSVYWLFYDWNRFKQELITESTSPEGTYAVHAYRSDFGATTGYAVLGELIFNQDHRKSKKIYWQADEETAKIIWKDDQTVIINGVQIEIPNESYDYRHGIKN